MKKAIVIGLDMAIVLVCVLMFLYPVLADMYQEPTTTIRSFTDETATYDYTTQHCRLSFFCKGSRRLETSITGEWSSLYFLDDADQKIGTILIHTQPPADSLDGNWKLFYNPLYNESRDIEKSAISDNTILIVCTYSDGSKLNSFDVVYYHADMNIAVQVSLVSTAFSKNDAIALAESITLSPIPS